MAVAVANCPTMATEVWNACAKGTRRGPSMYTTSVTRKDAMQQRRSTIVGEACRNAIGSS
jgi:hypothetical protein